MQFLENKWIVPIVAMFLVLSVSSMRMYSYLDGVLNAYAQSFHVDTSDFFVYWTFHTRELQQLIDSLDAKKKEFEKREESLNSLQSRLDNEKKELVEIKQQLETMRLNMSTVIVQAGSEEMKNLKSLATTYAAMSADSVVNIFGELDDNTAVKILALMKSDTVGPIFEAMLKIPGQETQMRSRVARLSEKMRLYKQAQAGQ